MDNSLLEAKKSAKQAFGSMRGFQGVGLGEDHLKVYMEDSQSADLLPPVFEGFRIEIVVIGEVRGQGSGVEPQALRE